MKPLIDNFPDILNSALLTIELTILSILIGLVIGFIFALMRISKIKILSYFSYYYSFVFRGTPLFVQIFIIYFGLAQLEFIRESILWVVLKKPYWCAIIAFALNTGAYTSEIFRSGFEKIDQNLIEAANSLD